jgi:hypothetical protein
VTTDFACAVAGLPTGLAADNLAQHALCYFADECRLPGILVPRIRKLLRQPHLRATRLDKVAIHRCACIALSSLVRLILVTGEGRKE